MKLYKIQTTNEQNVKFNGRIIVTGINVDGMPHQLILATPTERTQLYVPHSLKEADMQPTTLEENNWMKDHIVKGLKKLLN